MILLDETKAKAFLLQHGITNSDIKKIAGDASFRSYYRIFESGKEDKILMFAPPGHEDVRPFIKIDEVLQRYNFSAPKIYAVDRGNGFMLLEDFGDDSYSRVLAKLDGDELKKREFELYQNACNCLLELGMTAAANDNDLLPYNNSRLFNEVMLFIDWYLRLKNVALSAVQKADYKNMWFKLFDRLSDNRKVLVLRDYHADNLLLVRDRKGIHSVGLLDFQDALVGSAAYDLVSLLEDARRDLVEENRQKLLECYLKGYSGNKDGFLRDYAILSLQRNIKILGIFARLSLRDNKHAYLNLLPRVVNFVKLRLNSSKKNMFTEVGLTDFLMQYL